MCSVTSKSSLFTGFGLSGEIQEIIIIMSKVIHLSFTLWSELQWGCNACLCLISLIIRIKDLVGNQEKSLVMLSYVLVLCSRGVYMLCFCVLCEWMLVEISLRAVMSFVSVFGRHEILDERQKRFNLNVQYSALLLCTVSIPNTH